MNIRKALLAFALLTLVDPALSQTMPSGGGGSSGGGSITINGVVCNVNGSCTISAAASLIVGSTTITSGTNSDIEFNNAGVLGEKAVTGTGSVVLGTSPTISGLVVTGSFTATGLVTNADLANSSMTIAGHSISLGGTQTLACSDLTGAAASCSTDATNAANISSGTLPAGRMPAFTGDITTSAGAVATTLATVNSNVGTYGDATHSSQVTLDAKGRATAASSVAITPAISSVTGLGSGVATALAITHDTTGGVCTDGGGGCSGGGSVSVTAASPNIVINPSPGTGTFTIGATYLINAQTGATYTIASTDMGKLVTFSNSSAAAVTLPVATTSGFGTGASFDVQNLGAGTVTITPTTSTINGASSLALAHNQGCTITSDGTNYQVSACTAISGGVSLGGTNTWTAQQSNSITTLSISTATFTPDGSNNNYKITLVHASCPCTLANPSVTPVAGTAGVIEIGQSSTGSDTITTWGSDYIYAGGTSTISLSSGANDIDFLSYYVIDSTHILLSTAALNASH